MNIFDNAKPPQENDIEYFLHTSLIFGGILLGDCQLLCDFCLKIVFSLLKHVKSFLQFSKGIFRCGGFLCFSEELHVPIK